MAGIMYIFIGRVSDLYRISTNIHPTTSCDLPSAVFTRLEILLKCFHCEKLSLPRLDPMQHILDAVSNKPCS